MGRLPPAVRALHVLGQAGLAAGEATALGTQTFIERAPARLMGFPPAGQYRLVVEFTPVDFGEIWVRHFGRHRMRSQMQGQGGHLVERFGPLRFQFEPQGDRMV